MNAKATTVDDIANAQDNSKKQTGQTTWISQGFETLIYERANKSKEKPPLVADFHVVIVGSGYGGSVAAAELAGCQDENGEPVSVCVLERGKEYLPGMFPSRMADLASHVRFSTTNSPKPRGRREGLFDVRVGPDVCALVANGLGGGSLINAGVMEEAAPDVLRKWPTTIGEDLGRFYKRSKEILGAAPAEHTFTTNSGETRSLRKSLALAQLTGGPFNPASVTIAQDDPTLNGADVSLRKCNLCGDCATGCNFEAKNSLDINLLLKARRHEAEIYTGATVLRIERIERTNIWCLDVVHTDDKLRARQGTPFRLTARKIILAAGTFGSTEILLRSQSNTLRFSHRLGQRFSSNGDMFAVVYNHEKNINAVADEATPHKDRKVGPTITGVARLRTKKGRDVVIEELAVPAPLRRAFEEIVTTTNTLHELGEADTSLHSSKTPVRDPCAVDSEAINSSSMFALMGDDDAKGTLELVATNDKYEGDGAIRVRWPTLRDHDLFTDQINVLKDLVDSQNKNRRKQMDRSSPSPSPAATEMRFTASEQAAIQHDDQKVIKPPRVLPNPLWRLLPDSMASLLGNSRGPLLTVHPLGGCTIGKDVDEGVVNDIGQVFNGVASAAVTEPVFDGLVVLDGSIVPSALGINPALTITALTLRAVEKLRTKWNFSSPGKKLTEPLKLADRPIFRPPPATIASCPTEVKFTERISGDVMMDQDGARTKNHVEITLWFEPKSLKDIISPMQRHLAINESNSKVRFLNENDWLQWERNGRPEKASDKVSEKTAKKHSAIPFPQEHSLRGKLILMEREESTSEKRCRRAFRAYIWNRGLRDSWQWIMQFLKDKFFSNRARYQYETANARPETPYGSVRRFLKTSKVFFRTLRLFWEKQEAFSKVQKASLRVLKAFLRILETLWQFLGTFWKEVKKRMEDAKALATRAGEVRLFEYDLTVVDEEHRAIGSIRGSKRLTYDMYSNPWNQLQEINLSTFYVEALAKPAVSLAEKAPVLTLDLKYLVNAGTPLFGIVKQQDATSALADLVSFGLYVTRLLITIHIWSFRKPDTPECREPQRLPGKIRGLPDPEIAEIDVDQLADGAPVRVRLTRYRPRYAVGLPVVMIHGYSASGTTFAHHAVNPNLAKHFCDKHRDVWILDLRTSSGMPTARNPWTFEDAAFVDIPAAFDYIRRNTHQDKLDVIAHCMGAAMLSMVILARPKPGDKYFHERDALPSWINKAVLSQVGPVVVFSPVNLLRAYVMSYLRYFLPLENYEFRVGPSPSLKDQLIDRVLAKLPYPQEEFRIENPLWPWARTPFVGTRHRMDALYGRDFSLKNIDKKVLKYIDDLFGPLNIDTVSQAIHFARLDKITSRTGRDRFVSQQRFAERWKFATLSVHGKENGLSDVATLTVLDTTLRQHCGVNITTREFADFGHQDSLIGKNAEKVFKVISTFLEPGPLAPKTVAWNHLRFVAEIPWIGPIFGQRFTKDGVDQIPLSAGIDPKRFGKVVAVAFVPVTKDTQSEHLTPIKQGIEEFAWLQAIQSDRDGWFRIDAKASHWDGETTGVLMILLYNQAPEPKDDAYREIFSSDQEIHLSDIKESQIKEKIIGAIKTLLDDNTKNSNDSTKKDPADNLGLGLIEFNKHVDQGRKEITFAFGSCQYSSGLFDTDVAKASYQRLANRLDHSHEKDQPQCLLLLGDQVYLDATAGLFDPTTIFDKHVRPYELLYRNTALRQIMRRLPTYTMLDDHEIADNWEPEADNTKSNAELDKGREYYLKFQRRVGPTPKEPIGDSKHPLWYTFEIGDFPFFMADTRTERERRTAAQIDNARIMSTAQFNNLTKWLGEQYKNIPKFVASPSMLLPRSLRDIRHPASALRSDTWIGYPSSFYELLAHIADHNIMNVIFLSGDEHLSCVVQATLTNREGASTVIHSIHSSGLYAPFPFANAIRDDFALDECFDFQCGEDRCYKCKVETKLVAPGDGFAVLNVSLKDSNKWQVTCDFDREAGVRQSAVTLSHTYCNPCSLSDMAAITAHSAVR